MHTFSHCGVDILVIQARVYESIQRNLTLFKYFNGPNYDEAVSKAYYHAIHHLKPPLQRSIDPYIKKLAQTILQESTENEVVVSDTNEEGEVAVAYHTLSSVIEDDITVFTDEALKDIAKLYLLYPMEFERILENLKVVEDNPRKMKLSFSLDFQDKLKRVMSMYDMDKFMDTFLRFCELLKKGIYDKESKEKRYKVSLLNITEDLSVYFERYSGVEVDGGFCAISEDGTMSRNLDYENWKVPERYKNKAIYKVDISNYMNMLYANLYLPKNESGRLVEWFNGVKCFISPAGKRMVDIDDNEYITYCLQELFTNLLFSTGGDIIAISPDNVYIAGNMDSKDSLFGVDFLDLEHSKGIITPCAVKRVK